MNHPLEATSTIAAVATPHPQAAIAAREVLELGGNAIDASVAAVLALCVVTPSQVGLGGYAGCMVTYLAKENRVAAIDFDSRCPIEFRPELFAEDAAKKSLQGGLAVTVPGVVAGLSLALRQFGSMSFAQVARHAVKLAEEGFELDQTLKTQLDEWHAKADAESRSAYVPDGRVPGVGQQWVQRDLAALIRRLGEQGPEFFYHGRIPRTIVRSVRARGGILSEADFADFIPRIVEPLQIAYRGHELFTSPPPAGGITAFQILKTLEQFDIKSMDPSGAEFFHILAEAIKLCWHDRTRSLGDPDFVKIPMDELLSNESASAKAAEIRSGRIARSDRSTRDPSRHTVNISAVDREGNVVSIHATHGFLFGSTVAVPGLGLILNHGMSRFDFDPPGNPNSPAPRKRMHHNMSPVIALKDRRPVLACGLPGGAKIIPVTARLIVNAVDFGLSPGRSIQMPRIHVEADEPVRVSPDMPPATVAELESRGHRTEVDPKIGGATNVVMIEPKTGQITAADSISQNCVAVL